MGVALALASVTRDDVKIESEVNRSTFAIEGETKAGRAKEDPRERCPLSLSLSCPAAWDKSEWGKGVADQPLPIQREGVNRQSLGLR